MAEPDDDDDFPNDFDGLDFDHIPELQAPTINRHDPEVTAFAPRNVVPPIAASPAPSARSSSVEPMDPVFLAAVDVLEARVLNEMNRDQGSGLPCRATTDDQRTNTSSASSIDGPLSLDDTPKTTSDSLKGEGTSSLNQIGEDSPFTNRKGKRKAESEDSIDIRSILAGYETELTCPICCDLLVGAQVASPCGHTMCGECGYQWLGQNIYEPTCAVCRSNLSVRKPLVPCFTTDNLVQQHLQALKLSGSLEWQERGYKTIEWNKRLESWKKQAVARAEKEKLKDSSRLQRRRRRFYDYEIEEYSHEAQLVVGDDSEEDELVPRAIPRRGTRSRR